MGICVNRQPSQVDISAKVSRDSVTIVKLCHNTTPKIEEEKTQLPSPHSQETKISSTKLGRKATDCGEGMEIVRMYGNHLHIEGAPSATIQTGFSDKCTHVQSSNFTLDQLTKAGLTYCCKKGLKPESPNQDDFSFTLDGDTILMGVFDGHGPDGHFVSDYVHKEMITAVRSHENYESDPIQALKSAFFSTNERLITHCEGGEFGCVVSGTTASVAMFRGNKVLVAHVGDSRVVLGRKEKLGWKARQLTVDHKPTIPEEKDRIERCGGEVKQLPGDIPHRVFVKGSEDPGLSMSRSIGDTMSQSIGVLCDPSLLEMEVSPEDEFLLMCSDGVWEFISNEEAVEMVAKFAKSQVKTAAEKLAQLAWMRWLQHEEDVVDDITVILAFLPKP